MRVLSKDAQAQAALSFLFSESTYVEQEVLQQPYPEIMYPKIVPIDTSAPAFADSIAFKTFDFRGEPKLLGDRAGDIPLVEIASSKGSVTIHTYAEGYDYTIIEIGKAMEIAKNSRTNALNILTEKPEAVRMLIEQFLDKAFFLGDGRTVDVKTGLLNDANVPTTSTGTLLGGSDETITEIINDIGTGRTAEAAAQDLLSIFNNAILEVFVTQTNSIFRPSHVLLPLIPYGKLSVQRIPNTTDTLISYLERVLKIKFEPLLHLAGIGAGGTDRGMVYTRNPKYVKGHMPMPFNLQAPATKDNVSFISAGLVRIAGTEIRIPKQHLYIDNI